MNAPLTREDIAVTQMHYRLSQDSMPTERELHLAKQAVEANARRMWTIAKLTAIKEAANRAIDGLASKRITDLHYAWEGHALYNACFDLTGCDELYDVAAEIATLAPQELAS